MAATLGVTSSPVHETISRRRVFQVAQLRGDSRDMEAQLMTILAQLRDEKFSGQLNMHLSQGRILEVESIETHCVKF